MGTFERGGLEFNYETMGDPGAPPVVLLHGFTGESRNWYPVMRGLADRYFVVAPDLRGHGRSAAPEGTEAYAIEEYAADLGALFDHLGIELAAVVGSSFGGMVALQFSTTWPDRVAALCVSDASPAYASDRYTPEFAEREGGIDRAEAVVRERGPGELGRRRAATVRDPRMARAIREQAARMSRDGWLGAAHARRTRPDLIPVLRDRLTMPVLICTGDEDPVRSAFQVMREELPGARAVTFLETGHGVPMIRPEQFVKALVAFLEDVEASRPVVGDRTA